MARPKKQADIEDAIKETPRKNSTLTEDERRALHFRHCSEYERVLDVKKKADAALKNVAKRIKAEDDSVSKVKKTIQARSPEGEAELRAEIEQTAEVLRWSGVAVGESKELFPSDLRPGDETAKENGKIAGLRGESAKPPHDPGTLAHKTWMEGWQDGQAILASSFQKIPVEDDTPQAPELIPAAQNAEAAGASAH